MKFASPQYACSPIKVCRFRCLWHSFLSLYNNFLNTEDKAFSSLVSFASGKVSNSWIFSPSDSSVVTYENCYWRSQSSCLWRDVYIAKAPSQVILISKPHHFSRDLRSEGRRWTNCQDVPFRSQFRHYGNGLGSNFSCFSLLSSQCFGSSCTSVSWDWLHHLLLLSLTFFYRSF